MGWNALPHGATDGLTMHRRWQEICSTKTFLSSHFVDHTGFFARQQKNCTNWFPAATRALADGKTIGAAFEAAYRMRHRSWRLIRPA